MAGHSGKPRTDPTVLESEPSATREEWYRLEVIRLEDALSSSRALVRQREAKIAELAAQLAATTKTLSTLVSAKQVRTFDDSLWNEFNNGTRTGRPYKLTPAVLINADYMHNQIGLTAAAIAKTLRCDRSVLSLFFARTYSTAAALAAYAHLGVLPQFPAAKAERGEAPGQEYPQNASDRVKHALNTRAGTKGAK